MVYANASSQDLNYTGESPKTDFILCFIPKLALLEPFNVKSLT